MKSKGLWFLITLGLIVMLAGMSALLERSTMLPSSRPESELQAERIRLLGRVENASRIVLPPSHFKTPKLTEAATEGSQSEVLEQ